MRRDTLDIVNKGLAHTLSLCTPSSRREWLRLGGLTCLGLSVGDMAGAAPRASSPDSSFGAAKSCILIFLGGGPPQHETFDPKPEAPREVRGVFKAIGTPVPGMQFCELLPRTALMAGEITVIRSMHTDINVHSSSGYWMLTGREHPTKAEVTASPDDWPSIAAVVGRLKPSKRTAFSSVILPEVIRNDGAPLPWPGQTGGFMGTTWHPQLFQCDPSERDFRVEGLHAPEGLDERRVRVRGRLREALDAHFLATQRDDQMAGLSQLQQAAFDAVRESAIQAALKLEREPIALREHYGATKFGQSLLLARRMVESGVRLVQVNWPREPNDMATGNPMWDTHHHNADRLRDHLCPPFDRGFAALLADLRSRGMLQETLVVVMGEFGRTPAVNARGGRDHWGPCFSVALAGGGVPGGQVVGASDAHGAYPKERLLRPPDLAASIFHLLGIAPRGEFTDRNGRPRPLIEGGQPIRELVG